MTDLTRVEAAAAGLDSLPTEEEAADYLGRLDKVIRTLQGHRRVILDELTGPVSGQDYRVVAKNKGNRSYNTAGLIHAFDGQNVGLAELVREDVARISWQWTNLQRAARAHDVDLVITHREIEDTGEIDGPLVGETWQSYYAVEATEF